RQLRIAFAFSGGGAFDQDIYCGRAAIGPMRPDLALDARGGSFVRRLFELRKECVELRIGVRGCAVLHAAGSERDERERENKTTHGDGESLGTYPRIRRSARQLVRLGRRLQSWAQPCLAL